MTPAVADLRARLEGCRGVLVDSNVLLDVATNDPYWSDWSGRALAMRGGSRNSPLPDFYIGAHAAIGRLALLTRDAARYRTYFPKVQIFSPPKQHAR